MKIGDIVRPPPGWDFTRGRITEPHPVRGAWFVERLDGPQSGVIIGFYEQDLRLIFPDTPFMKSVRAYIDEELR
jgi:hypothetical protein